MTVPPGAVAAPVSFTLDQIAVDPASVLGAVGPGYRIGPEEVEDAVLKTSKAATLTEAGSTEEVRRWLEGLKDDDLGH